MNLVLKNLWLVWLAFCLLKLDLSFGDVDFWFLVVPLIILIEVSCYYRVKERLVYMIVQRRLSDNVN